MSENEQNASILLRENFLLLCSSFRPALLSNDFPEQTIDTWLQNAQNELLTRNMNNYAQVRLYLSEVRSGSSHLGYCRQWIVAWAVKANSE